MCQSVSMEGEKIQQQTIHNSQYTYLYVTLNFSEYVRPTIQNFQNFIAGAVIRIVE